MESSMESIASSSNAPRSRGRPRKDANAKYQTAYEEVRRRSIKVNLARMAQAYHGHRWVNRKMKRAFLKSFRLAVRNGGYLPVVEVRKLFGRWVQSLEGSQGYMIHKSASAEAEVVVPDNYIIPPINFHRAIRGHVFAEDWDDFDIKNCHFVLVRDVCQALGISCPAIRKYIEDREALLQGIIDHCGNQFDRDVAKALFLRMLYGGSWRGFVTDITKPRKDADGNPLPPIAKLNNKQKAEPSFCKELYDEATRVYLEFSEKDAVTYAKVLTQRAENIFEFADDHRQPTERKTHSKCFASYIQTIEREIVDACMRHCEERGLKTGIYMYDGFTAQKGCGTPELLGTFKRIAATMGYDLDFEVKPMRLVEEWAELPTDIPDDDIEEDSGECACDALFQSLGCEWEAAVNRAVEEGTYVTDESIALVVKPFAKGRFLADVNSKGVDWYRFGGHRWRRDFQGVALERLMTDEVAPAVKDYGGMHELAVNIIVCKLCDVTQQRKTSVALRKHLCAPEGWVSELDNNRNLLCFEDGVLEIDGRNLIFRDGRPEDMCSKSTRRNFPTKSNPKIRAKITKFYEDVFPDPDVQETMWKDHAHSLLGQFGLDIFWFFLGNQLLGANGKGTRSALFKNAMGDYVYECDAKIMSQQCGASGSSSSELAKTRGCRRVIMMEPEETIRNKLLKERTGGGKIQARQLYHEAVEFKSFAVYEMQCNEMPEIDRQDGGTFRRVTVVAHPVMFVENPKPGCDNQRPLDKELRDKFESDPAYGEEYMLMLLERHREGKAIIGGRSEFPESILELTRDKLASTNVVKEFVEKFLVVTGVDSDRVKTTDLWNVFKKSECFRQGMRSSQLYSGLEGCGIQKGKYGTGIWYYVGVYFADSEDSKDSKDSSSGTPSTYAFSDRPK